MNHLFTNLTEAPDAAETSPAMSSSRAEPPPIRTSTPEPAICRKESEWTWRSTNKDEGKKNERLRRRSSRSRA
ncbi:unnamed protein product, partial [Brassica napus]